MARLWKSVISLLRSHLYKEEVGGRAVLGERGGLLRAKRRNGIEILRDVLQVCVKGANKTHIVYAANMNSKRIGSYLDFCLNLKFVKKQYSDKRTIYRTTPEGLFFMSKHFGDYTGTEKGENS